MNTSLHSVIPYVPPSLVHAILEDPSSSSAPRTAFFPAAVLFADISGFTPLAERFAHGAPGGAEELTRLLNLCFVRLIECIDRHGGEVVKFSGDALTVLLPTYGRPLPVVTHSAVKLAEEMQAAMAAFARLESSVGPVSLGIKMGIGAGQVCTMQIGGTQGRWEYVVCGDPVRQATQAQSQAHPGAICLSDAARRLYDETDVWPNRTDRVATCPLLQPHLQASVEERIRQFVPAAVRHWLRRDLGEWMAVLRRMTVLFVQIHGLSGEEATLVGQLHAFLGTAQEIVYGYEGSVNKLVTGDKGTLLLVLFGAPPWAHEDDALRALHCARALQDAFPEPPPPKSEFPESEFPKSEDEAALRLSMGLATGPVFAGPVGGDTRREYTVMGDTVNLAARLMDRARPGVILCDLATFRQTRNHVFYHTLPPMRLKGRTGLTRVYRPDWERWSSQDRSETYPGRSRPVPLVGRTREMAELEDALRKLRRGQGGLIVVEGEAGIGKSRLVHALRERLEEEGLTWLPGSGHSIEQRTPYRAWRDILNAFFPIEVASPAPTKMEQITRFVEAWAPSQVEQLPLLNAVLGVDYPETPLTAALEPALRKQNLKTLLLALLRARARSAPLALIIEDAQWLDTLSAELVLEVARTVHRDRLPLLLVVVSRPLYGPLYGNVWANRPLARIRELEHARSIRLEALSPDAMAAFIRARLKLGADAPPPLVEIVNERARGNPFFAEEMLVNLRSRQVIKLTPDGKAADGLPRYRCHIRGDLAAAVGSLPDTLQGLVLSRIDRLPPERQMALKVGAVIGGSFPHGVLSAVLRQQAGIPDREVRAHMRALADLDLVTVASPDSEPCYAFVHIVTQEVAYQSLLFEQRRQLHVAVARWYEQTFGDKCELYVVDDAGSCRLDASRKADPLAPYYPLLVHHYRQAGLPAEEQGYAVLAGIHAAHEFANAEAIAYFTRALELTPPGALDERCRLLLGREAIYSVTGERTAQEVDLTALETMADTRLDPGKRSEIALRRANYARQTSDYPRALEAVRQALHWADVGNDHRRRAEAHLQWGRILWRRSEYEQAETHLARALELARQWGNCALQAGSLRSLGLLKWLQGRFTEAETLYTESLDLYEKIGDRRGVAGLYNNLATLYGRRDAARAAELFDHALRIQKQIGDRHARACTYNNLSAFLIGAGRYDEAAHHNREALRLHRKTGNRRGEGLAMGNVGALRLAQGDYAGACQAMVTALSMVRDLGDRRGMARMHNHLAGLYSRLGLFEKALHENGKALTLARSVDDRATECEVLLDRAHVLSARDEYDQARRVLEEGQSLAWASEDRALLCRAWIGEGELALDLGDPERAQHAFEAVPALLETLGHRALHIDYLAGRIAAALAGGVVAAEQTALKRLTDLLSEQHCGSVHDPFRPYLVAHRALVVQDLSRADAILALAQARLQATADRLEDPEWRRAFLRLETNRRLRALPCPT